ncbi:MAG: hypothetical protein GDA46_02005 [Bdellovibrionales bacterium]|nr:hypothetical protein [Bdellovibrionales bacterium]
MNSLSLWTKNFLQQQNLNFYFQDKASSSNDLAKKKAFQNKTNPSVFLVKTQTKGRGYNNKKWENSDLMISFLWQKTKGTISSKISKDFAKDVEQALKKTWPELNIFFKAPNDLYLNEKKLAGLLIEILTQGFQTALIVGLGLNVFSTPKNLRASCLKEQLEKITHPSWNFFLKTLIQMWSQRVQTNF